MRGAFRLTISAALLLSVGGPALCGPAGASFLKIGVGARALGMNSAFTAVADDASALHWNPAGLARLTAREAAATHAAISEDSAFGALDYVHPLSWGVLGFGAVSLSQSPLEGRDGAGGKTGSFGATDAAVSLAVGKSLGGSLSGGLGLKFVRQELAGVSARGVALDAGLMAATPLPGVRAGLSLQNLGPSMRFVDEPYRLPLSATAGLSWRVSSMLFALDVRRQVHERETQARMGLEFSPFSSLSLRAGYAAAFASGGSPFSSSEAGRGFAGGVGVLVSRVRVDYSFTPMGDFGNAQRLSLGYRF